MNTGKQYSKSTPRTRKVSQSTTPGSTIRHYAAEVAERFQPHQIILFGSYAYGTPRADSDVDILVVMPARNQLDQAFKIRLAVPPTFPMDLIVRTPKNLERRLAEGESFLTEIVSKGLVLYEKNDGRMGAKGRRRSRHRAANRPKSDTAP